MNSQTKEERYKSICSDLDEVIKLENPCGIMGDGKCVASRMGKLAGYNTCCRKCRYLGETGCKEMILGCKLYFCVIAWKRMSLAGRKVVLNSRLRAEMNGFGGIMGEKEF